MLSTNAGVSSGSEGDNANNLQSLDCAEPCSQLMGSDPNAAAVPADSTVCVAAPTQLSSSASTMWVQFTPDAPVSVGGEHSDRVGGSTGERGEGFSSSALASGGGGGALPLPALPYQPALTQPHNLQQPQQEHHSTECPIDQQQSHPLMHSLPSSKSLSAANKADLAEVVQAIGPAMLRTKAGSLLAKAHRRTHSLDAQVLDGSEGDAGEFVCCFRSL